jgi:hypothetical protein
MNEVFKFNTAKKVIEKIKRDTKQRGHALKNNEIAHRLGFKVANYITMVKNPKQHDKIPAHAWEKFRTFVNSGIELGAYQARPLPAKAAAPQKDQVKTNPDELHPDHKAIDALQGGGSTAAPVKMDGKVIAPKEPSPVIKEIITPGSPLNKRILALIDGEPGQDPVCKLCFEVDFKITINGRPI